MKMYTVNLIGMIVECEVKKVTDKFVVLEDGHKVAKDSQWDIYRNSIGELKIAMINRILSDIKETEKTLDYLKDRLERTKNIEITT